MLQILPVLECICFSALLLGCRHCRSTHDADVLGSQRYGCMLSVCQAITHRCY